jgi:hypothetical protein
LKKLKSSFSDRNLKLSNNLQKKYEQLKESKDVNKNKQNEKIKDNNENISIHTSPKNSFKQLFNKSQFLRDEK